MKKALLLLMVAAFCPADLQAYTTQQAADVVIGQPDITSNTLNNGGISANSMHVPVGIHSDRTRFFVIDGFNNRVLIYNHIPTADNASADIEIGQPDMTSNVNNGAVNAAVFFSPTSVYSDGTHLFVADHQDHRVLIYHHIPTANNASADIEIGQPDMTSKIENNGGVNRT